MPLLSISNGEFERVRKLGRSLEVLQQFGHGRSTDQRRLQLWVVRLLRGSHRDVFSLFFLWRYRLMSLLKCLLSRKLFALVAATVVLSAAGIAFGQPIILIDGLDEANLASEGNWFTTHPNVNFAFTYNDVVATNLNPQLPGMAAQCTACSSSFHYTSTADKIGGAIGFGTNQLAFDANRAYAAIALTVNPGNALTSLTLILKDTDLPTFAAEDLQYGVPIPATPGDYVLTRTLNNPSFVFNAKDSIPNFQAGGLGLSEVQLQYPFGLSPAPDMDLTIHSVRIIAPEPSALRRRSGRLGPLWLRASSRQLK